MLLDEVFNIEEFRKFATDGSAVIKGDTAFFVDKQPKDKIPAFFSVLNVDELQSHGSQKTFCESCCMTQSIFFCHLSIPQK
ncbi:hypothetical protein GURASL_20920 [Geotalea uraniireducens]|uniref:Uncharacterized protein n=1 Tax=Geotalea uraniireducens TaxID=351604 RepID=A0ABM8ELS0_9BACT|nr:hypothetical protein GURASL_20920 [Geotalea uraniireducens]